MVCSPAELNALPAETYRRQARRLRASFCNDLPRLQRSLRQLANREDARQRTRAREAAETARHTSVVCRVIRPASSDKDSLAVDRFAALVESEIQSGILRHSQRMALLRQARRLDISRFDANLIIASVQHRAETYRPRTVSVSNSTIRPRRRFDVVWGVIACLAIEIPLAIAAWKILHP